MSRFSLLQKEIKGTLLLNEPMKRHTSFGIGGEAEAFILPADEEDILNCLSFLQKEGIPYYILGNGTNILVSDQGLKGAVIKLGRVFEGIDLSKASSLAGTPLPKLLNLLGERGLSGLEHLAGIPGTVGGAVVVNAGIPSFEIGEAVKAVRVFKEGKCIWLSRGDIEFFYRGSSLKDSLVLEVVFSLRESSPREVQGAMKEVLEKRRLTQPLRERSAGCVFKNPPSVSAGELLEKAGAKGLCQGEACVSSKHANFIINEGNAKARDVIALIKRCRELVKEKFNIELQLEIELWGEFEDWEGG